ncbi:MAG: D-glycero-alpha-D-manno-heptose-1,7-bisphosphate 7-phosphatase [Akkermansia muciniphila]
MRKALFLDRDGTVNVEKNYLWRPEEFELLPGILDLVRAARERGYAVVVCTNQSGIARGYYTEADYRRLTEHMLGIFEAAGCPLQGVYHCPELSGPRRKPAPGMFLQAEEELGLDMPASLSLGDKVRDAEAGHAAGVGRNYLLGTEGTESPAVTGVVHTPADLIPLL